MTRIFGISKGDTCDGFEITSGFHDTELKYGEFYGESMPEDDRNVRKMADAMNAVISFICAH